MKSVLIAGALSLALAAPVFAQQKTPQEKGLSAPVIALTGVLAKNADALNLDDTQRADLKTWLATMPAKRGAVEDETAQLRAELRAAIVANKPVEERQALADKIGANETKLVMMRSGCTDHWRKVLSAEQFDQLLTLAKVK